MNQQEINSEILSQNLTVYTSKTPMFTEYVFFGQTLPEFNFSTFFEEKKINLIQ